MNVAFILWWDHSGHNSFSLLNLVLRPFAMQEDRQIPLQWPETGIWRISLIRTGESSVTDYISFIPEAGLHIGPANHYPQSSAWKNFNQNQMKICVKCAKINHMLANLGVEMGKCSKKQSRRIKILITSVHWGNMTVKMRKYKWKYQKWNLAQIWLKANQQIQVYSKVAKWEEGRQGAAVTKCVEEFFSKWPNSSIHARLIPIL